MTQNNEFDLKYSEDALLNRPLYLISSTGVNIFVEDTGKEYEYEAIFNRLFNKNEINIKNIFAMGGKKNLIEGYKKYSPDPDTISLFIADGDFDMFLTPKPGLLEIIDSPHFIYLDKYNIESYFIDEIAISQYMSNKFKKTLPQVKSIINYSAWKNNIYPEYYKLFLLYMAIKEYKSTISSVGRSPYIFFDNNTGLFKSESYTRLYNEIKSEIDDLDTKLESFDSLVKTKLSSQYDIICGKYLIESLYCYLKNIYGGSINKDDFKYFLICQFNINQLDHLKYKILSVINP